MILQDHSAAVETLGETPLIDFKAGGLITSHSGPHRAQSGSGPANSHRWASRLFGWLSPGRPRAEAKLVGYSPTPPKSGTSQPGNAPGSIWPRSRGEIREMVKRLIDADRYAFVLLKEAIHEIDDSEARGAQDVLRRQMALVPFGSVPIMLSDCSFVATEIGAFYLDRYAVTNRQFQKFIEDGGYDTLEIWPSKIWPSVVRFTDRTGHPGPRDWANRTFPARQADHPVVGICWYEAAAYARWVGKRLPTAAEWQKAGGWPDQLSGGDCNRYPWGDLFEPAKANLASAQIGGTVPVERFAGGHHAQRHFPDDRKRLGMARRFSGRRTVRFGSDLRSLEAHAPDRRRCLQHLLRQRSNLPLHHGPRRARPSRQHRLSMCRVGRGPSACPREREANKHMTLQSTTVDTIIQTAPSHVHFVAPRRFRANRAVLVFLPIKVMESIRVRPEPPRFVGVLGPSGVGKTVYLGHAPGPACTRHGRSARRRAEPVLPDPSPQPHPGPGATTVPGENARRVRSLALGALRSLRRQEQVSSITS